MSVSVSLPALGESVTEGIVTRRLKAVGDEVAGGEPLLEVSTDKADTEIPSPVTRVLLEIAVAGDETAEVGAELAVIGTVGAAPVAAPATPAAPTPVPAPVAVSPADDRFHVPPLVRKLASENGVDLSTDKGTGVGGRIRKQDVIAAAEAARTAAPAAVAPATAASKAPVPKASPLRGRTVELPRSRKVIAGNMHKALHEKAQLSVGIAVDSGKGLMTPVIKDAGELDLAGIARRTAEPADKVRMDRTTPDDLAGATFTISGPGSRGVLSDTAVIPPDHVAIRGIGATVERPVVASCPELGDTIAVRDMTYVTLSYDHRLVDGADEHRADRLAGQPPVTPTSPTPPAPPAPPIKHTHRTAGQSHCFTGSKIATHSTWYVIGRTSA